jgi:hypothetical protein
VSTISETPREHGGVVAESRPPGSARPPWRVAPATLRMLRPGLRLLLRDPFTWPSWC